MTLSTPEQVERLAKMVDDGKISRKLSMSVLKIMKETGKDPEVIIEEQGMIQLDDRTGHEIIIRNYVQEGKCVGKMVDTMISDIIKLTKGCANPQFIYDRLQKELKEKYDV